MLLASDVVLCKFVQGVGRAMVILADGGLVLRETVLVDSKGFVPELVGIVLFIVGFEFHRLTGAHIAKRLEDASRSATKQSE